MATACCAAKQPPSSATAGWWPNICATPGDRSRYATCEVGRAAMTRIVCLANSWKRSERCVAGIDLGTGRWVRPVTASIDGSVPRHVRAVRKGEPGLLDQIDLPLASTGPDFGFECENRLILPGRWYV